MFANAYSAAFLRDEHIGESVHVHLHSRKNMRISLRGLRTGCSSLRACMCTVTHDVCSVIAAEGWRWRRPTRQNACIDRLIIIIVIIARMCVRSSSSSSSSFRRRDVCRHIFLCTLLHVVSCIIVFVVLLGKYRIFSYRCESRIRMHAMRREKEVVIVGVPCSGCR